MTTATISLSRYCSRDLTRLTPQGAAAAAMACQRGAAQRIPERASRSPRRSRDGELLPSPSGLSLLSCCHVPRLAQRPHPDDAGHRSPEKITIACSSSTSADTPSPCPRLIGAQRGIYHWRLFSALLHYPGEFALRPMQARYLGCLLPFEWLANFNLALSSPCLLGRRTGSSEAFMRARVTAGRLPFRCCLPRRDKQKPANRAGAVH
jgi:hypothetical protein